jgi:hypothetical protein
MTENARKEHCWGDVEASFIWMLESLGKEKKIENFECK